MSDLTVFGELSDSVWANLMLGGLTLPPLPPAQLQRDWCGNAGAPLAQQSLDFYSLVKTTYARYARQPLQRSRVLDFGCGWGRLTRLFGKDLPGSQIFGCDSDPAILEYCRELPGTFKRSDAKLGRLPFPETFDLIFAFSVFTHLGPDTQRAALTALHASLDPGGLMIATIRPRAFIDIRGGELSKLPDAAIQQMLAGYDAGEFIYHPYNMPPVDGEVPYGEAVIPRAYVDAHWTDRFAILEQPPVYASDPYQVAIVLRRR
jgi:SAM-dependent methyltransferase